MAAHRLCALALALLLALAPRSAALAVLPPLAALPGEGPPAFAERTAAAISHELGIPATAHTTDEKRDVLRKLKRAGKAAVLRDGAEAVLRRE